MATNPPCKNCDKGGLPILPVRYTVLPKTIAAKLPGGISGARVTDIALTKHKYGLRILREGWIYLLYEKGARGANYWEAYRVTEDGRLWRQNLPLPAVPVTHPSCAKSSGAAPMDIIAIEQPELCGKVHIAFSGETWTDDIFRLYVQNADLRAKRMQCIEPANWIAGGKYEHAAAATEANINDVIEYMPGFDPKLLQPIKQKISDDAGKHKPEVLKLEVTRYPLHIRQATPDSASKSLIGVMNDIGKKKGAGNYPPMVLALWDAVGNLHELNGFRNDPVSWFNQYADDDTEQALQVAALRDIDTAHRIVQSRQENALDTQEGLAQQAQDASALGSPGSRAALGAQRAKALAGAAPSRVDQINAWYDDMDWMAANNIPGSYQARLIQAGNLSSAGNSQMTNAYTGSYRDSIMNDARRYAAAQPGAHDRNLNEMTAYDWSTYKARLRPNDIDTFRKNYVALQSAVYQLQEDRSGDVGQWVKAPLLLDTLEDCHSPDFCASLTFEIIVSEGLFGLTSTPKGKAVVDSLITQWDPTQQGSLIWRVMAMNQMDARKELGRLLKSAQEKKNTPLDKIGDLVVGVAASTKSLTGYYKKLSTLALETDSKKITPIGTLLKRFEIDKFGMTVGDAIFEKFRVANMADFVGEKIIQTLFLQRAGIPYEDAITLVRKQAVLENLSRIEIIDRVRVARKFLRSPIPQGAPSPTRELYEVWDKTRVEGDGAKQLRLGRIAVVTLLVETVNFLKLLAGAPDKDTRLKLVSSGASLCSSVITIAIVPYQAVLKASVRSQGWKLTGGALSSVGVLISAWMDVEKAKDERAKGQYDVAYALRLKALLGGLSGTAIFIDAISSAAPLLKKLASRYGTEAVMAAVEAFAERIAVIAGVRAVGMLIGWEATIGLIILQALADWLTPNALESWCSRCAFGTGRETTFRIQDHDVEQYKDAATQSKEFIDAMAKVS
ncbi:T6SS effector BTH_I2691 family protein [Paraburkholderia sp. BR10936]|uniref:T6SS effector BTH_I2691 family protein n=1 Tax=Paraburkholderia sp. BR10936 TaxID=3236993 RepID=UPI0034D32703